MGPVSVDPRVTSRWNRTAVASRGRASLPRGKTVSGAEYSTTYQKKQCLVLTCGYETQTNDGAKSSVLRELSQPYSRRHCLSWPASAQVDCVLGCRCVLRAPRAAVRHRE